MKLYKAKIKPVSNFATSLKGDTIFGHLCWMIRYRFGENRLKTLLSDYDTSPFMVVSDAFASGYLPKPKMPQSMLGEDESLKKDNRKKIWLTPEDFKNARFTNAKKDEDIDWKIKSYTVVKNSLNYQTNTTSDDGKFAPYGDVEYSIKDADIYILIDENIFTKNELFEVLNLLSEYGYGKDSSTGKGRFELIELIDSSHLLGSGDRYMALSPFSPEGLKAKEIYYETFTRFGRFGADRAKKSAFKAPVLLADTASVIVFDNKKDLKFIGKSIKGLSETYEDAIHQGYTIVLPFKESR